MDEMDFHTQKKIKNLDFSIIFSLIPKEERILFISERSSNKKLAISIRILILAIILLFIYLFLFLPFNGFSINWTTNPILAMISDLVILGIIIFINYLIGKKYYNFRKDFYIIITDENIITLIFSKKYKTPINRKYPLSRIQYFSIKKRLFRKSANLILFRNTSLKFKLKRIKDCVTIQKYLDSLFFHLFLGKSKGNWLSKAKYSIPLNLNISESVYYDVRKRLKNISFSFGIATPILIFIGVLIALTVKLIGVVLGYAFVVICFYGFFAILYFSVWYQLMRCSPLEELMILKNDEIVFNDNNFPLSKSITISTALLSKWEHVQRTMRPLPNIYCIEINDFLTINKKKYFGPIEDFQNCFNFIYNHILDRKNMNGHLFSKEELYKNEIKR